MEVVGWLLLIGGGILVVWSSKISAERKKKKEAIGIIACLLVLPGTGLTFAAFVQKHDTKLVARELGSAADRMKKKPAGIKRGEAFIEDLKRIDGRYAPKPVKKALTNYIAALEQALKDSKTGQNTEKDDAEIEASHEILKEALRKNGS
jgi:hypothetical protein